MTWQTKVRIQAQWQITRQINWQDEYSDKTCTMTRQTQWQDKQWQDMRNDKANSVKTSTKTRQTQWQDKQWRDKYGGELLILLWFVWSPRRTCSDNTSTEQTSSWHKTYIPIYLQTATLMLPLHNPFLPFPNELLSIKTISVQKNPYDTVTSIAIKESRTKGLKAIWFLIISSNF